MSCCNPRGVPDSDIPFEHLGCPCDTWSHLKDMFVYLKDERAGGVPCKPEQFKVQWTGIDAMTYMFVVTDNITGEIIEYSVTKEFTKESPEQAFERDWRFRELVYNRGVNRAMEDLLEAMEETNTTTLYKLSRVPMKSHVIHKPIQEDLGVIVFQTDYLPTFRHAEPMTKDQWNDFYSDMPIQLPDIVSKVAYGTDVLLKRFRKIGVKFLRIEHEELEDLKRFTIVGVAYRDHSTDTEVRIRYQEMDLDNPILRAYHTYFTTKGPQNGFFNC